MNKIKRILALIGVLILVGIYIVTFISAIFTTPATDALWKASIYCTVAVPVLLYAYMLIYKILKKHREDQDNSSK